MSVHLLIFYTKVVFFLYILYIDLTNPHNHPMRQKLFEKIKIKKKLQSYMKSSRLRVFSKFPTHLKKERLGL